MPNVIDKIVQSDICVGCGVCTGACPKKVLKMDFDKNGEYKPKLKGECNSCKFCLEVCPFENHKINENILANDLYSNVISIKKDRFLGYYLDTYVAYSQVGRNREKGASGGMVTWFLEKLLDNNNVDAVISVIPNNNPNKLFKYSILNTKEEVRKAAGSVYYPVELSEVIEYILNNEQRFAIVGLPCFIKALRLMMNNNYKLKNRVKVLIGLVCGQQKNKKYTDYLIKKSGLRGNPNRVYYRVKNKEAADNFFFYCKNNSQQGKKLSWKKDVSSIWSGRFFTINACNYCDDIFSELADIVFMDAWLPKYSKDPKGTNLVIARSPLINNILQDGLLVKELFLQKINKDKVINSQKGVINEKRYHIKYRIYLDRRNNLYRPKKRVCSSNKFTFHEKQDIVFKRSIQYLSNKFIGMSIRPIFLLAIIYKIWMKCSNIALKVLKSKY